MGQFYGWRVVGAAFVLAFFGWGLGFYGPPVYLQAVREARGFSLSVVSAAVTLHFLSGAVVAANVPALYRRFGLPTITKVAAVALAAGVFGWAIATTPWQLFLATLVSGAGWAAMSGVTVNAIVSPWFVRARPSALGTAYNGASLAGLILSLFVGRRHPAMGFPAASPSSASRWWSWCGLASHYFARTPADMSLARRRHAGRAVRCGDLGARAAAAGRAINGATSALSRSRSARRSRCSPRSA